MRMLFLGAVALESLIGETAALYVPASQGSYGAMRARAAPSPSSAMHLRGGYMDMGIVFGKRVAKVALGFTSVCGGISMLHPKSEVVKLGFATVGLAVLGYMSLAGKPLNEAIAWAQIPFMVQCINAIRIGNPISLLPKLGSAFTFWALFNNVSFSANVVELVICYNLFSGAFLFTGFGPKTPEHVLSMELGLINLRFGVMVLALQQGASAAQAVGCARLAPDP